MVTVKLKNFGFYKGLVNLMLGLHIIGLILCLLLLFTSFLGINIFNGVSMDYANRHMTVSKQGDGNEFYINKIFGSEYFKTDAPEKRVTLHSNSGGSYSARVSGTGALIIDIPDSMAQKFRIIFSLLYIALYLLALMVLYRIRKILFSLKDGSSSTFKNAESLSFIATVFFILPVLYHILIFLLNAFIESTFNIPSVNYFGALSFDVICIFVGLLLAILSYVLKQGVIMQQEQDLTI